MTIRKKLGFLISFTLPLMLVLSHYIGTGIWIFLPAIYSYLVVPVLDLLIDKDTHNVLKQDIEKLTEDSYFDFLLYGHVWAHITCLLWGVYVLIFQNPDTFHTVALMICQGVYASTIINVSHELGHRTERTPQFHARLALITVGYSHFTVEHNRGHHVHVATPSDPATSKKNQHVYAFWWQTLSGSLLSAWNLETKRLEKTGKSKWNTENKVWTGIALTMLFFITFSTLGWIVSAKTVGIVFLYFIVQSTIAVLSLECVNYIEHYGIVRKQKPDGRYERVNPLHSWNSNHTVSNLMLFNLQRHSDHHAYAVKPYQVLDHLDESPQLPFGYPLMIILSFFPSLWYSIMNPLLEKWQMKTYAAG
ncbi:MAG: alkane 1-monooxygenase [Leadbetterella sp.]